MRTATARNVLLLSLAVAGGCTNYRYAVLAPDQSPLAVRKDQDLVVPADPARLRVRQVENRCVLLVENPTTQPVALDGAGSTIVDPMGQSRQVASQLIAAGSFVKLILPPLNELPPAGPAFQFGIGAVVSTDAPRPANYLDTGRAQEYWEWSGEETVRVILALKQATQTTTHEIVIRAHEELDEPATRSTRCCDCDCEVTSRNTQDAW